MKVDFKKSLGQNFFVNRSLAEKIVSISTETKPSTVIEIGPGSGSFTQIFYPIVENLICIEKDIDLIKQLKLEYPKATIINEDFMNLSALPIPTEIDTESRKRLIIYGSLPYNLAKRIIEKCFLLITQSMTDYNSENPIKLYFIIQKEVAESYVSKSPNNTVISVITNLFAKPKIHFHIRPQSFFPVPRVMSSLIEFEIKDPAKSPISQDDYEKFISFLRVCFKQPRKTLNNNLKPFLSKKEITDEKSQSLLTEVLGLRPQQLELAQFVELFRIFR